MNHFFSQFLGFMQILLKSSVFMCAYVPDCLWFFFFFFNFNFNFYKYNYVVFAVICLVWLCFFQFDSSSGPQLSRGRKRPNPSSALALVEPRSRGDIIEGSQHSSALAGTSQAPICRPWDRGDLMRRLATFKSMTWFAKPKV